MLITAREYIKSLPKLELNLYLLGDEVENWVDHFIIRPSIMLYRLQERAGLDIEHIMRLGGWESLDMGLRYTRSVRFEESLSVYQALR